MKSCTCGLTISARASRCTRCLGRLSQRRYQRTAKGRAANERYERSEKRAIVQQRNNPRRIYTGGTFHGYAESIELAQQINAHIKERVREFTEAQRKHLTKGEPC